jgi:hypothetical protein
VRDHGRVDVTFSVRADGQVDTHLAAGWQIFQDALDDSISSLPPRRAPGNGPSAYWVDRAEQGARAARESGDERPFASGNITFLRVSDGMVVATYDFAENDEPGQAMPFEEFLALLVEWRRRIEASSASTTQPLPDTYRRNPAGSWHLSDRPEPALPLSWTRSTATRLASSPSRSGAAGVRVDGP